MKIPRYGNASRYPSHSFDPEKEEHPEGTCPICRKTFTAYRPNQRFCSEKHRNQHHARERKRLLDLARSIKE